MLSLTTIFHDAFIKNLIKGTIGCALLMVIGHFLEKAIGKSVLVNGHHEGVVRSCARFAKHCCTFFGVFFFLKEMGIDLQAILTGVGLTGFAIGFVLKDTLSNIAAGIFIIMYRPFHLNDKVTVIIGDKFQLTGVVSLIDFRYTSLKTDKGETLVPNSILYNNPLILERCTTSSPTVEVEKNSGMR